MINLVPPVAKKSIITEYWIRVASVWLMLWAFTIFAAASMLLPTYVLINSRVSTYEASAAAASQKVADYQNASQSLIRASQQAKLIVDEKEVPQFSKYIWLLKELQGEGIQFTMMSIQRAEGGTDINSISVGGVASSRETLASLRDRLKADERIESVDLPISNLARDKDIVFNMTIVPSNQAQP